MRWEDWVPAHRRLFKGRKRSFPRGVRFVLLELSYEAKLTGGVLDLRLDLNTVDAVHDLIGGKRSEIAKAIQLFTLPDEKGEQTIQILRETYRHRLIIVRWEEWAGPKTSTDRVREHRHSKQLAADETFHRVSHETIETPTVQNSTVQYKTVERDARDGAPSEEPRTSERRLKSVPPPPPVQYFEPPSHPPAGEPETGYDMARRIFAEAWQAKYHEAYVFSPALGPRSEDMYFRDMGALAREREPIPARAEELLRRWAKLYLRDAKPAFVNDRHPARYFQVDLANKYGGLPQKRPVRALDGPQPPPLSPEETKARALALVAGIGRGGK